IGSTRSNGSTGRIAPERGLIQDLVDHKFVNPVDRVDPFRGPFSYSSTNLVGFTTAMVLTSSAVNPASSNFWANIAKPSATGGLMVWPRSVEMTVFATPDFRMLANAVSQGALLV